MTSYVKRPQPCIDERTRTDQKICLYSKYGDPKSSKPSLAWLIFAGNSGKESPEGQNSSHLID